MLCGLGLQARGIAKAQMGDHVSQGGYTDGAEVRKAR